MSLTREEFEADIGAISTKSDRLGDTFRLVEARIETLTVRYLVKREQFSSGNELLTCEYHVVYSDSFQCPVLYLNVSRSNGSLLSYQDLYAVLKLDLPDSPADMIFTQQDHPVLNIPFFYLHPCKTREWMDETRIVEKDEANNNNQSILNEQNLKYWYTVHTALDVIEEKVKKTDFKDLYLGLLYLIEDYRINHKTYRDLLQKMFKKLHSSYISCICNPFYEFGQQIQSKKFDELVKSLMQKPTNPTVNTVSSSINSSTSSAVLSNTQSTTGSATASSTSISGTTSSSQSVQSTNAQKPVEFTI